MSRPTIEVNLDKKERQEMEKKIRETKDRKKADRLRVILYKDDGHSNKFIARSLQIGRNQVSKILERYQQAGWQVLLEPDNYQGSQPSLTQQQQQALKIELKTNIYSTANQVIAWVEQQWAVQYGVRNCSNV